MSGGRRHNPKRRHEQREYAEESEVVDDLAYAATFAFAVPDYSQPLPEPQDVMDNGNDGNEIDLGGVHEDDDNEDDNRMDHEGEATVKHNDRQDNDPSDGGQDDGSLQSSKNGSIEGNDVVGGNEDSGDEESDVDLVEAVERMTEDEDNAGASSNTAPKTQNELDPYRTPLDMLEKDLNFHLTIEDDKATMSGSSFADTTNLPMAGTIRSHLVQDRTVVVESIQGGKLLDEGSLLVIRSPESLGVSRLVPLGRIFEVFGPVHQPLYTIRLPQRPKSEMEVAANVPKGGNRKGKHKNAKKSIDPMEGGKEILTKGASNDETPSPSLLSETAPRISDDCDATIDDNTVGASSKDADMSDGGAVECNTMEMKSSSPPPIVNGSDKTDHLAASGSPSANEPALLPPEIDGETVPTNNDSLSAVQNTTDQPSGATSERQQNTNVTEENETPRPEDSPDSQDRPNFLPKEVDQSTVTTEPSPPPQEDHWAPNGVYTQLLMQQRESGSMMPVYFIQDEAKLIDTGTIMRNSGKGSDASNLYDEEVTNVNEIYYSDDEEERQSKNRRKPQQSGETNPRPTRPNSGHRPSNINSDSRQNHERAPGKAPRQTWTQQGMHQQPPPRGFHQHQHQQYQYQQHPRQQGFYHPPASGPGAAYPPMHHQPPYGMPAGALSPGMSGHFVPPPPPPPPPPPGRPIQGTGYPPPPPPPPSLVPSHPPSAPTQQGGAPQSQQQPGGANAFYYDYS